VKFEKRSLLERLKVYVNNLFITKGSSVKFVFVGKGGVGKTTLCALLATALDQEGYKVLAIDANPDAHLAKALGIEKVHTIAHEHYFMYTILDGHDCVLPHMYAPHDLITNVVNRFGTSWGTQSTILTLGAGKYGGIECFLSEKSALWSMIRSIHKKSYDIILIDTESGLEPLRQGFSSNIDILVSLFQTTQRSIDMAKDANELAHKIEITTVVNVLIGYLSEREARKAEERFGAEIAFKIPYLESIHQSAIEGSLVSLDLIWKESMKNFALNLYANAMKTVA